MSFLELFVTASVPVLNVLLVTGVGSFIATNYIGILHEEARKNLNNVVFYVFNPSLVSTNLARTITPDSMALLWFMPVNVLCTVIFGSALGWIVIRITKPPPRLRGLIFGCCSAGFQKMSGSSSSQQSRSKKKNKPVGPIQIHTNGSPFGTFYDALADHISRHVTHCDEFSPLLSWPEHKNAGRVERLYRELTPIFSLPEWGDQQPVAIAFRKWFNWTARHRFSDHKWRSLFRTFERCQCDVAIAVQHVPESVDSETWAALCEQYAQNMLPGDGGQSKKSKCKASREANDYNHRMGRDALSVWKGKFREARGEDPNPFQIYQKEYLRIDVLDDSEGAVPIPHPRGTDHEAQVVETGRRLQQAYEAAITDGSDESTASTRACLETFGRVSRLGMQPPRGTRSARRDAYTSELEQKMKSMQESWDADRERITQLEQSQREMRDAELERIRRFEESQKQMQDFMAKYMADQQSGGQSSQGGAGGSGDNNDDDE